MYSNVSGTYVSAQGNLAHTGPRFVYYEDVTNTANFSAAQYAQLDSITMLQIPRLDSLLGPLLISTEMVALLSSSALPLRRSALAAKPTSTDATSIPPDHGCGGLVKSSTLWRPTTLVASGQGILRTMYPTIIRATFCTR